MKNLLKELISDYKELRNEYFEVEERGEEDNFEKPAEEKLPVFLHETEKRPMKQTNISPHEPENTSICIYTPKKLVDILKACKDLKQGSVVLLNYNDAMQSDARSIFFFMQGYIYALNGTYEKISNNIFLYSINADSIRHQKGHKSSFSDTLRFQWKE